MRGGDFIITVRIRGYAIHRALDHNGSERNALPRPGIGDPALYCLGKSLQLDERKQQYQRKYNLLHHSYLLVFPKLPDDAGIMNILGLAAVVPDFFAIVNGNAG